MGVNDHGECSRDRFRLVAAVHLVLLQQGKVLLLRRFNTGYEDGNYSVPAGHLDGDEPATHAMARETLEETGLLVRPAALSLVHTMHRRAEAERLDLFFAAREWSGTPTVREPDKCDELRWCPADRLPPNTVGYVRAALTHVLAGVAYSEYGWDSLHV